MKKLCSPKLCCALFLLYALGPFVQAQVNEDYRLAPLDLVVIDVVGEPQLNKELRISASGSLTFPYLGKVEVKNLSVPELENKIQSLLAKDYIIDPQVIVTVKEYRKRFVTVIGEANKQGPVEFLTEQPLNLVEAIGLAGGPTKLAKDTVQVTRNGRSFEFSLRDLRRATSREEIPVLAHGDIIYIPQSAF